MRWPHGVWLLCRGEVFRGESNFGLCPFMGGAVHSEPPSTSAGQRCFIGWGIDKQHDLIRDSSGTAWNRGRYRPDAVSRRARGLVAGPAAPGTPSALGRASRNGADRRLRDRRGRLQAVKAGGKGRRQEDEAGEGGGMGYRGRLMAVGMLSLSARYCRGGSAHRCPAPPDTSSLAVRLQDARSFLYTT